MYSNNDRNVFDKRERKSYIYPVISIHQSEQHLKVGKINRKFDTFLLLSYIIAAHCLYKDTRLGAKTILFHVNYIIWWMSRR